MGTLSTGRSPTMAATSEATSSRRHLATTQSVEVKVSVTLGETWRALSCLEASLEVTLEAHHQSTSRSASATMPQPSTTTALLAATRCSTSNTLVVPRAKLCLRVSTAPHRRNRHSKRGILVYLSQLIDK